MGVSLTWSLGRWGRFTCNTPVLDIPTGTALNTKCLTEKHNKKNNITNEAHQRQWIINHLWSQEKITFTTLGMKVSSTLPHSSRWQATRGQRVGTEQSNSSRWQATQGHSVLVLNNPTMIEVKEEESLEYIRGGGKSGQAFLY